MVSIICLESQSAGAELPGILRFPRAKRARRYLLERPAMPGILVVHDKYKHFSAIVNEEKGRERNSPYGSHDPLSGRFFTVGLGFIPSRGRRGVCDCGGA